jgi:hypothetical protein
MKHLRLVVALSVAGSLAPSRLSAHDLFFRPDGFRLAPGSSVVVKVLNGTFSRSENAITRDRIAELSLVGPSGRQALDLASWTEQEPMSTVSVAIGSAGTHVLGAAIKPRPLSLPAAEFNAYLKEEGIDHILELRRSKGQMQTPSQESYSKYLKALLQSGGEASGEYAAVLGHEAEIVPLGNPYALKPGDTLAVRCLVKGRPLAGYTVFAGGRKPGGDVRLPQQRLTTDADGVARVRLTAPGSWYVKFVHMEPSGEAAYESRWATISFAVEPVR